MAVPSTVIDPAKAASGARATRSGVATQRVADAANSRERIATRNQVLFGAVVFLMVTLALIAGFTGDVGLFFAGALVIFISAAATPFVPWDRIPPGWVGVLPAIDIIAIAIMRIASPGSDVGFLWVFPAMWAATAFGVIGLAASIAAVVALTGGIAVYVPDGELAYALVLRPLVVASVATVSFLTAKRSAAQRVLLAKQAALLGVALERTRRQEQSLGEVLDAVDFGIIRIDAQGRVAVTNDAHGRLQRAIGADSVPDAGSDVYRPDGVTRVARDELPLARALKGESFDDQVVWFGEEGPGRRALAVSARRLQNVDGGDGGAVIVSRDITAELSALRARDELVASVSHELRTPLTSILGYLDLALDDDSITPETRGRLEVAERNAERLLELIGDILAASSPSRHSGELTVRRERIDIADVVRASVEALQPKAAQAGVTIDESGVESTPAFADPKRIRQVVDNLVSNAVKFNDEGGTVTIGCARDGEAVWIIVRDTGAGIPDADQARLFERYYRGRAARRSGTTGTGLGLSISRELVRAHGGDITVRSAPGMGSTFAVRFPAEGAPSTGAIRPHRSAQDEAGVE